MQYTRMEGLSSEAAEEGLQKYGPNTIPLEKQHSFLQFLKKFWAPVPWMLEVIIVLEIVLGKIEIAGVIGLLLLFNAVVSFFEEGKAKGALRLLKSRLEIKTRVMRDGEWKLMSAQQLVPGDLILLRMGDIIPADVKLIEGNVLIDQSAISGESLPIESEAGKKGFAGSIVRRGQAYAQVFSTGKNTFYGKSAEIMRATTTPSHLETTIFTIVKYLVAFDICLIIAVFLYAFFHPISLFDVIPFSLLLLVASVPVALPATYTLSTALGAMELAKKGVLVTRLSAIEEAAAMNILCADKTGTITKNALCVSALHPYTPYSENDLLRLALFACEAASQDPIDLAILSAAKGRSSSYSSAEIVGFIPFDPDRKCSQATIHYQNHPLHILKGSPTELMRLADKNHFSHDLEALSLDGSRVIGVLLQSNGRHEMVGLIALQDPPRENAKESIAAIHDLGIRVMMMTGDESTTARFIAKEVGIGPKTIAKEEISPLANEEVINSDAISGVYPEDKFSIIQILQDHGYICGMTGDGVNDAPALKKAEVGIAVSNATEVAKASASLVLTRPGLVDIIEAVKISRQIYQRMLTYTLNKIIKTLQIAILLGLGLILTNQFIISQLLIVLLLFANDIVTMSISTDRVSFSRKPDHWDIKKLMLVGGVFAVLILGLSFFILFVAFEWLHLSIAEVRTVIFLTLVFSGQATVYLVRERHHFLHSMPSRWLMLSSLFDLVAVTLMAIFGLFMAPISPALVFGLLAVIIAYFVLLDLVKIKILKLFHL